MIKYRQLLRQTQISPSLCNRSMNSHREESSQRFSLCTSAHAHCAARASMTCAIIAIHKEINRVATAN